MKYPLAHEYVQFQVRHSTKPLLNIGVGANPIAMEGEGIYHLDIDRWGYKNFIQADAHCLPFRDDSFATALCGDVLGHLVYPLAALKEMRRIAPRIVLTTYKEWRLGAPGQHIEVAKKIFSVDESARRAYPEFIEVYPEELMSHIPHINQWTDDSLHKLIIEAGMRIEIYEQDEHNYMFLLSRV